MAVQYQIFIKKICIFSAQHPGKISMKLDYKNTTINHKNTKSSYIRINKSVQRKSSIGYWSQVWTAYNILTLWSPEMAMGWIAQVRFQAVQDFLFSRASRLALGPTQPPTQWVLGTLPPAVKQLGREAGHSPQSSAEVKNAPQFLHSIVLN
jgi:hypothetical protein